jgi:hypothetical protein
MLRNRIQVVLTSAKGAIDLASIMVGIIVIGLIAAVIAATIFMVIPWSQDKAAKDQLGSVVTAESANAGFTASAGKDAGYRFTNKQGLMNNPFGADGSTPTKLLQVPANVSVEVTSPGGQVIDGGNGVKFGTVWTAAIKSATGKIFYISSENQKPQELTSGSIGGWDYGSDQTVPTDTSAPWVLADGQLGQTIADRLGVANPSALTLADAARFNDALIGSNPVTFGGLTTAAGLEKATGFTKLGGLYVGPDQDSRGLENIRQIDALVFLPSSSRTAINGNTMFPNLTTVSTFTVSEQSGLTSINGFDNLTTLSGGMYGGLTINRNNQLTSISGFSKLVNAPELNMLISDNVALRSFTAFGNLATVGSVMFNVPGFTDVDGFMPKLVTVTRGYQITGAALTRVVGQASLKEVKGLLYIEAANATTVSGYTGLTSASGLSLVTPKASVSAFANLTTVNGNMFGSYTKRLTGAWSKIATVTGTVNVTGAGVTYTTLADLKASPSSAN